jgi:hypothetical protein
MIKDFIPTNVSLWIVNFKRREVCDNTIKMWLDSYPFETVNVISNFTETTLDDFSANLKSKIKLYHNCRNNSYVGSLAECWNQCYINTFEHKNYCICSQDDVVIKPGWDKIITDNLNRFDTFFAPQGDVTHLQTVDGFKKVGWWDINFRTTSYQEMDYYTRCLLYNKKRISISDVHNGNVFCNNEIGLNQFWIHIPNSNDPVKLAQHGINNSSQYDVYFNKYGVRIPYDKIPTPRYKAIDYCPEFSARIGLI